MRQVIRSVIGIPSVGGGVRAWQVKHGVPDGVERSPTSEPTMPWCLEVGAPKQDSARGTQPAAAPTGIDDVDVVCVPLQAPYDHVGACEMHIASSLSGRCQAIRTTPSPGTQNRCSQ